MIPYVSDLWNSDNGYPTKKKVGIWNDGWNWGWITVCRAQGNPLLCELLPGGSCPGEPSFPSSAKGMISAFIYLDL